MYGTALARSAGVLTLTTGCSLMADLAEVDSDLATVETNNVDLKGRVAGLASSKSGGDALLDARLP